MKHTPGPWIFEYDNADEAPGGQWYTAGPARVWFSYGASEEKIDQAFVDARLIAAAPELLEALRLFVYLYGKDDVREWMRVRDQAVAAIAKAEGKA